MCVCVRERERERDRKVCRMKECVTNSEWRVRVVSFLYWLGGLSHELMGDWETSMDTGTVLSRRGRGHGEGEREVLI